MELRPITLDLSGFPEDVAPFLAGAPLFDSSCSPEAQVLFADRDGGCFVKSAPAGTLATEAAMTRYFHGKGLAGEVLAYVSAEHDWLVTERVPGADATTARYLDEPRRLCDLLAQTLVALHETDRTGCPVTDHTQTYLARAEHRFAQRTHEPDDAPRTSTWSWPQQYAFQDFGYATLDQAHDDLVRHGHLLRTDTLLHGDYCLPNVILDGWALSGFVDLDNGGVGDPHVDVYWALWSLQRNLGTDEHRHRFLDAYGRDRIDEHRLRLCAAAEAV